MAEELVPLTRETPGRPSRWRSRSAPVQATLPPLTARSVGGLLDAALDILGARFWICTGIAVAAWVPIRAVASFLRMDDAIESGDPALFASSWLFGVVAPGAVRTLVAAMVALIVCGAVERVDVRPRAALLYTLRRAFALFILMLVNAILTGVGTCAFLIPGILVSWIFYVAPTALVVEGVGIGQAIRRSYHLVQRSFWRWLGLVVAGGLFVLPLELIGAVGDNPQAREPAMELLALGPAAFEVLLVVVSAVLLGISTAISSILVTVFYLDCRIRREGHDLRLEIEALESERGAAGAGAGPAPVGAS